MLTFSSQALTVGAITDEKALAHNFERESADLIELRLDSLGSSVAVMDFAKRHAPRMPLLITARDPKEGGLGERDFEERLGLLGALLPFASAVDVELQNAEAYAPFLAEARAKEIKVVLSNHNFSGFDHVATIEALAQAHALGADVAKAAVTLHDPVDLTLFESLLADMDEPFSLMGMGPYGPVSRLLSAQHGSLLNYGYLGDEPTAPGQWPAALLKTVLGHCPSL